MKAGSTYLWKVHLEGLKLSEVSSIIFTLKSSTKTVSKVYPSDVSYDGKFNLKLSQQDTLDLVGIIQVEAQINFQNKAVVKSTIAYLNIMKSLATKIIDGNTPNNNDADEIELDITDVLVEVGGGTGTDDYNVLTNKPTINGVVLIGNSSLEELGIDEYVNLYIESHKADLKGEKGDKGNDGYTPQKNVDYFDGKDGKDYVITENDYNAIADVVIGKLQDAEEVEI